MKTRDVAGLAITALFIGGLLNISWVALVCIGVIGTSAFVFEFLSTLIRQDGGVKSLERMSGY